MVARPAFPWRPAVTRLTNPCRSTLCCSIAAPRMEQDACRTRRRASTPAEQSTQTHVRRGIGHIGARPCRNVSRPQTRASRHVIRKSFTSFSASETIFRTRRSTPARQDQSQDFVRSRTTSRAASEHGREASKPKHEHAARTLRIRGLGAQRDRITSCCSFAVNSAARLSSSSPCAR